MRVLLRVTLVLTVLLLAAGAFLLTVNLAPLAMRGAAGMTGRAVTLGGLRLGVGAVLRVELRDLHVPNVAGGSDGEMLALRRMQADILWLPLLTGRLAFAGVAVDGLKLKLERDKAGAGNWRFGLPRAPAAGRMVAPMMTALDVTDTHVTWRTSSAAILRIDLADAAVRAPTADAPVTLVASGAYAGVPITLRGEGQSMAVLRDPAIPYGLIATATSNSAALSFKGTLADPYQFDGVLAALRLEAGRLADLLAAGGLVMTANLPLTVAGALDKQGNAWALTEVAGQLGRDRFSGRADMMEGARGEADAVALDLRFASVDGDAMLAAFDGGGSSLLPVVEAKPSTLLDANLALDTARWVGASASAAKLRLRIAPALLTLEDVTFSLAGGAVRLAASAEAAAGGTHLLGGARITGAEAGRVAAIVGGPAGMLAGPMSASAAFSLTGTTPAAALAHSRISLAVAMRGGSVGRGLLERVSVDLRRLWRDSVGLAALECLVVVGDLTNGSGPIGPLRLLAANVAVSGGGTLDLGRRRVDITLASESQSSFALDIPVRINGPLADPQTGAAPGRPPRQATDLSRLPADVQAVLAGNACLR